MSKAKLFYFDAVGRGDMVRIPFHIGGIPFDDVRIDHAQWPGEHKAKSPTGQLPYMHLPDGTVMCESMACCMYGSTLAGLVPTDPCQAAFAEQACGVFSDAINPLHAMFEANCDREKILNEMKAGLAVADKVIGKTQGPTGYAVGNDLTFADIYIYTLLYKAMATYVPEITDSLIESTAPNLHRLCLTTARHPKVAAFYGA